MSFPLFGDMDFIVETGAGLVDANAFTSVEYCDKFNAGQLDGQDWAALDFLDKQVAIVTATSVLNVSYDYFGRKLTRNQALEFPRYGVRDRSGWMLSSTQVPVAVQAATAELARILRARIDAGQSATGGSGASGTTAAVESIAVGPISVKLASASSSSSTTTGAGVVQLVPRSVSTYLMDFGYPRFGFGAVRAIR